MMSGQTSRHEYLESQLADFVGKPDAFLLNFGYQGMISIIDSLTSRFAVSFMTRSPMLVSWTVCVCRRPNVMYTYTTI